MTIHWLTGTDLAIALAAFLLLWYVVGGFLNRRRAGRIVRQVRDSIESLGGNATIRWIGRNAFRIEVDKLTAPFEKLSISGLLEPRETFFLWLVWRLGGRQDWLMIRATLNGAVGPAFEVYHPRRRGAADVSRAIRSLDWRAEVLPGHAELLCASADARGKALAGEILATLRNIPVWRVGLQSQAPQLTLSLPVPTTETRPTLPIFVALPQLAATVLAPGHRS
ncbi:MAG TPA: hypothetical protein VLM91_13285 [Candidatus Methylomirabilis sp.]|nr:hypothetical protein [Candidatus Methylomirabilis sp.]